MKVKELLKKYPGYKVIESGTPNDIPFTNLPRELNGLYGKDYEKVEMELEVAAYEVFEGLITSVDITHLVFGGKKKPNQSYKGTLYIYFKRGR